ncbi:MAG: hypothetical protein DRN81_02245 [Thermoproteota archaeon]|nr:MAG: hypothetical protein DRN81_02245 [Candidatus Korarchaeota archaeon]
MDEAVGCKRIEMAIAERISRKQANEDLAKILLRRLEPAFDADLNDLVQQEDIRMALAKIGASSDEEYEIVTDVARSLITDGKLEGTIDDSGKSLPELCLSQRRVNYRVSVDFA